MSVLGKLSKAVLLFITLKYKKNSHQHGFVKKKKNVVCGGIGDKGRALNALFHFS